MNGLKKHLFLNGRRSRLGEALNLFILIFPVLILILAWPLTAAARDVWSETGSMTTARTGHAAAIVPGARVFVAGGTGVADILSSVFIFDPLSYVTNGSFQTATVDPGDMMIRLASGSMAISGWKMGDGGIAQVITICPAGQYIC